MTLQQLRYAEVVAKVGSMNEVMRRLYVSQPSLSEAISGLEKTVGIKIFNRVARGVVLTPEGEEFMGYARQILNQVDLLEDKYSDGNSYKKNLAYLLNIIVSQLKHLSSWQRNWIRISMSWLSERQEPMTLSVMWPIPRVMLESFI